MTAPFVTTVTKPPAGPAGRSRLRRALLAAALLLPLLLAITLLAWMVLPKAADSRATWMDRLFGGGEGMKAVSVCSLAMDAGPCRGTMPRFFYSSDSGRCEAFLYGGCDGNDNNFKTVDMCNARCVGQSSGHGQRKEAGGGEGAAICTLPAVTGDCRAAKPRYFFDVKSLSCKGFTYGGCGGNGNNFETLNDCEKMCSPSKIPAGDAAYDCASEPDGGVCMAYMERYAYRPQTKVCEKFVYGGCGGNGNRYGTKEECEEHCARTEEQEERELMEGVDYDTKVCGVPECPMDCGHVRKQGDCVYCQCAHTPFSEPGEQVVAAGEPCPEGYTVVRHDFNANVCGLELPVPPAV